MSENTETEPGSGPDPKIEAEAKTLGWVPKEHFRGDPERWSDAETFVKRGKEILPIIRANNAKLQEQLATLRSENANLAAHVTSSNEAIAELKKYQDENTRREVEKERTKLLKDLKQAKKDDDTDLEVDIEDQIKKVDKALEAKPEPEKKPEPKRQEAPEVDPAFTAWLSEPENQWFQTDRRKQSLAVSIAQELRSSGSKLVGKAFFDRVGEEVHEYLGSKVTLDKVNGSKGGGGGGGGGSSGGKTYKDLPSDAKAACDGFVSSLVGPGRAYKTEAEWRTKYAADFFKE